MMERKFTQAEVDALIAQAVMAEREACVQLVLAEPELASTGMKRLTSTADTDYKSLTKLL